jgi:hypothetical protein
MLKFSLFHRSIPFGNLINQFSTIAATAKHFGL